jgi:hypothetical protein
VRVFIAGISLKKTGSFSKDLAPKNFFGKQRDIRRDDWFAYRESNF